MSSRIRRIPASRRLALERLEDRLAPASHTWSGAGSDRLWSNAANWSAGGAPQANETDVMVVFPANLSGAALISTNDIAFANPLDEIDFQGGGYTLGGAGVRLANGIQNQGNNRLELALTLAAEQTWAGFTGTLTVAGTVDLNGAALGLGPLGAVTRIDVTGRITGAGGLGIVGTGTARLTGDNDYTGQTAVAGRLVVASNNGLGAPADGTVVGDGAVLALEGGVTVPEPLTLTGNGGGGFALGALRNLGGDNTWSGPIELTDTRVGGGIGIAPDTTLSLTGPISGAGALLWFEAFDGTDSGTLVLGGDTDNTYAGNTVVTAAGANVVLNKTAGTDAIPGGTFRLGRFSGGLPIELTQRAGEQMDDDVTLELRDTGKYDIGAGNSETIAAVTETGGDIVIPAGASLALGAGGGSATLSAALSGRGELVKVGAGRLTVPGSAFDGVLQARGGSLLLGGALPNADAVLDGGLLGGNGSLDSLRLGRGGALSPGNSPGSISFAGVLELSTLATYVFELAIQGTSLLADKVTASGTVALNGATLRPSVTGAVPVGTELTLIDNAGTTSVVGTFHGMPEGSLFAFNGQMGRISYQGGDGNDVTLTAVPAAGKIPTTTTVTTPGRSAAGSLFPVTVQVSTARLGPALTGEVVFFTTEPDGTRSPLAGGVPISPDGTARAEIGLVSGQAGVTATYSGDSNYDGSSGSTSHMVVAGRPTKTTVTASSRRTRLGESFTATARVEPVDGNGVPTGTFTFFTSTVSDTDPQPPVPLVTVPVGADGSAQVTISLQLGQMQVLARYSGDAQFESSFDFTPHDLLTGFTPLTPNEKFIDELYRRLLGRPADPEGLRHFGEQLDRGVSTFEVARQVLASAEGLQAQVKKIYNEDLRRDPEPGGTDSHVEFLKNGGTIDQLRAAIIGSLEYFQTQGGGNDADFLIAVYRDYFGRQIDPTGSTIFGLALAGGLSRTAVALALAFSAEGRSVLTQNFYRDVLQRFPDAGGQVAHIDALQGGVRPETILAVFLGSEEFFRLTQTP